MPCIQDPQDDREFQMVEGWKNMRADKAGLYSLVFTNRDRAGRPFIRGFEVNTKYGTQLSPGARGRFWLWILCGTEPPKICIL